MPGTSFSFDIPDWVVAINTTDVVLPTDDERMMFVVDASRRNAESGGGPFAAGIFETATGKLIALGVNLVVPQSCCILHGEMVAIMLAQQKLACYDFSQCGMKLELVSSTEPCAMCYGAVPWSGVRRLVCAASEADARKAGFDEGSKLADWIEALNSRDINVTTGICRDHAARVLQDYHEGGGEIYNGRR